MGTRCGRARVRHLTACAAATVLGAGALVLVVAPPAGAQTSIAVGSRPVGIAVTPDGTRAYVANYAGGTVSVIDTNPLDLSGGTYNTVIDTIAVGGAPFDVAIAPSGDLAYVTNSSSNTVSVIDTNPGDSGAGTYNTVIDTISVNAEPGGEAITPDGTRLYVTSVGNAGASSSTVSVIDIAPGDVGTADYDNVVANIAVGSQVGPVSASAGVLAGGLIAISPDGNQAYVADAGADAVSVIDTDPGTTNYDHVVNTVTVGSGSDDNPVDVVIANGYAYVSVASTEGSGEVAVVATATGAVVHEIAVAGAPVGLAATANGDQVFVTNYGFNAVETIDSDPSDATWNDVVQTSGAGTGPAGVAVADNGSLGSTVYVSNFGTVPVTGGTPATDVSAFAVSPVGGGSIDGTITDQTTGDGVVDAVVQACGTGAQVGTCATAVTDATGSYQILGLADGTYGVTAWPANGSTVANGGPVSASISSGSTATADLALAPLVGMPSGTSLSGSFPTGNGVTQSFNWMDAQTLTTTGCSGGTATFTLTALNPNGEIPGTITGSLTETPSGSGTYVGTIPAPYPLHGQTQVVITFSCGGTVTFDCYIDPSGLVTNTLGDPVAGATVTLLEAPGPSGPFTPVPDGSVVMSPANRTNPDTTAANGSFGWDTIAGSYEVQAAKAGCVSPVNGTQDYVDSAPFTVPPPMTSLDLVLDCTARTATTVHVTASADPPPVKKGAKYRAVVSPAPTGAVAGRGTVTFTDNGVAIPRCIDRQLSAGGRATCKELARSGGTHTIDAVYDGDHSLAGSTGTLAEVFHQKPTFTNPATAYVTAGTAFSFTVTCIGYPAPTSLSETRPHPGWLTITFGADGSATLTGTPPSAGNVRLSFKARTTAGRASQALTIIVHG